MTPACILSLLWGTAALLAVALGDQVTQCPAPEVENGRIVAGDSNIYTYNQSVTFDCNAGHKIAGAREIHCQANGTWNPPPPQCEQGRACGHPGEPDNGRLIASGDFLFGSTVNYTCEKGHILIGQPSRRCVISNQRVLWTGDIPLCQRIPCFPPPDIPHGKHTGIYLDDFSYGTVVTYTCDEGYPLVGDDSIYCTTKDGLNGVWSGHAYCGVTQCPTPEVENGRIVGGYSNTYTYNQRVTLDCNAGHKMAGSKEILCQVDGTWDPPLPHCKPAIGCVRPEIQNGTIRRSEVADEPMETVTFECDPGYILKGSPTIKCQNDSTWDSPVPICVKGSTQSPDETDLKDKPGTSKNLGIAIGAVVAVIFTIAVAFL